MPASENLSTTARLLVALPQFPHDPASGAARTASTVGELLAQAGFAVEVVATTSTEGSDPLDGAAFGELVLSSELGVVRFRNRGVKYSLIDTGEAPVSGWNETYGRAYDTLFDTTLARFRPNIVLTYGGSAAELARQKRALAAGARVVFGLYNTRYTTRGMLDHVTAVVTPSEFLTRFYSDAIGLKSTPLPTPLFPDDVLVKDADPRCLTVVNPTMDKGLVVFASLVAALGVRYPEIPIEVYPSRDSPGFLVRAGLVAGIDLAAHPNLAIRAVELKPSKLYRRARVLLVPSLVQDAAPRVIAEALANGVPPIGSDRGGIPEMCADGGFVCPVPRSLDRRNLDRLAPELLEPWIKLVATLFGNEEFWRQASKRARLGGEKYLPPSVTESYSVFFGELLTKS